MGTCWGDLAEGVMVEVLNSDTNLSTKVYWIAGIVKLSGKNTSNHLKDFYPCNKTILNILKVLLLFFLLP